MPLFQQSVVKKYLNDLDKEDLQQRSTVFAAHFHNTTIQQNILNAKELKEPGKQKIRSTLPQQSEWMSYFEEQINKALALQS